jgi:hypothetical protein
MHAPEKRAIVRAAYVYQRQSLPSAAETADIPLPTARRWKSEAEAEGDDWDKARSIASMAETGRSTIVQAVIEDYLSLHQATIEQLKGDKETPVLAKAEALSRLADAFTKTMGAAGRASPELSRLAVATDVLRRLTEFVGKQKPAFAEALLDVLEPFAAELAKSYG